MKLVLIVNEVINMGVLALYTVGTTVGTSHTTVSTPGGTKVFPCYSFCLGRLLYS